jgi:HSP20 family protein
MWWLTNEMTEANPLTRMARLQQEMNRLFEGSLKGREAFPAVNIWNNADKIDVKAELPGADPKDIEVSVIGDKLSVQCEIKPETCDEKAVWHRQERPAGKFSRTFRLPYEVDSSSVEAKFKNGVLKLSLKRLESSKPRKIAVVAE